MAGKTYYELLGVAETASQDEIRKAYLKLARRYHPDKTGGDKAAEEKLKTINDAYDTLKNPEKRERYDAERRNPFGGGRHHGGAYAGGNPFSGFEAADAFGFEGSFADLFGDMLGRGRSARRPGPRPGADLEVTVTVTLREVAQGAKRLLRAPRLAACQTCNGSGAQPGTTPQNCPQCNGTGQVSRGNGAFFMSQTCSRCHGTGRANMSPCGACGGQGRTRETRTVTVTIPAGADDGMRLRLAGQGEAGESSGPPGDLYVVVHVAPDPVFRRDGTNIVCEAPVTFSEAVLGGKVRVPTLSGQVDLRVPPGTQSGQTLRLRGQGLPSLRGGRKGDQLVRVEVEVPKHLNAEQRRLIEQFRDVCGPDVHPRTHEARGGD
ncbi:MAG: molecular chaperone DnaJ [bacterium]|nr:molecular chaperone DnaJ [bacterium]